jgi:hypothetical protein
MGTALPQLLSQSTASKQPESVDVIQLSDYADTTAADCEQKAIDRL